MLSSSSANFLLGYQDILASLESDPNRFLETDEPIGGEFTSLRDKLALGVQIMMSASQTMHADSNAHRPNQSRGFLSPIESHRKKSAVPVARTDTLWEPTLFVVHGMHP